MAKLRASLADDVAAILEVLVRAARAGDMQAARLILERILPPVRPIEQAVTLKPPVDGNLTAKAATVLSAAGDLAPTQAAQLITVLGSLAKIPEVDELARRIEALEAQHGNA